MADIGMIGLGVMGKNLAYNMIDNGFTVAGYDLSETHVNEFTEDSPNAEHTTGTHDLKSFVNAIASPRKIMLMVPAGSAVDAVIDNLVPLLDTGDLIIDGGNSNFHDTERRTTALADKNILFLGAGISGGEEGARHGPSIMPGGPKQAWDLAAPILTAIAAKTPADEACCAWVGNGGAGHFVKMVHNGIEYADMQLICEAYDLLKRVLGLNNEELQRIFENWNAGELNSYLIEITAEILAATDPETQLPILDLVLDKAGQKGTGRWTSKEALDLGTPAATIAEAVFARALSAQKELRMEAAEILSGPVVDTIDGQASEFIENIFQALLASKIAAYAQGFELMRMASEEHNWNLAFGDIALLWREGCIIRAQFLEAIRNAFAEEPELKNIMLSPYFVERLASCQNGWRSTVAAGAQLGIPTPAFSSALSYYDSYRSAQLPANLLQAQRDFFGAHTFERTDKAPGEFFHFDWN